MTSESNSGRIGRSISAQVAEDLLFLASILTGQPGKCISDDVTVMQVWHRRIAAHVEP
jgi:hypothetical protein